MPAHRLIRLIQLLASLASRHVNNVGVVLERYQIDERTLRRDLAILRALGISIERRGGEIVLGCDAGQQIELLLLGVQGDTSSTHINS
jgi:predicted DNA-binding transcriptional regulator YafY